MPTQLRRLLAAGPATLDALRSYDGGAARRGRRPAGAGGGGAGGGVPVVVTYGMSETCGGCVYDGAPLDGVTVDLDGEQRIRLGGAGAGPRATGCGRS